jgi:hypothetical protein
MSSIGNSTCFSFLLTNNTSNQYGICLLMPRVFKDIARNVIITCKYCVCIITKLPFLSYMFNLLIQIESQGGLDFSEPFNIPGNIYIFVYLYRAVQICIFICIYIHSSKCKSKNPYLYIYIRLDFLEPFNMPHNICLYLYLCISLQICT